MCDAPNCKSTDIDIIFYKKNICAKCWDKHCSGETPLNKLEENKMADIEQLKQELKQAVAEYRENVKKMIDSRAKTKAIRALIKQAGAKNEN
jgi:Tfp pilus assembly PilM family ATPase